MAGLFVRLKLRLLRNGLRAGWQRTAGLLLGALFAVPIALSGFGVLAVAGHDRQAAQPVAVLGCTVLFLSWVSLPVLGFGTDETLDPARLALLPLTARQLMTGLLAASAVGIAPLATVLGLTGAVVGYGRLGPGAFLVAAAVVVELALCLAASRAVVTALAGLLRSRRGRDLMVIVATLVALLPQLLRLAVEPRPGQGTATLTAAEFAPAVRVARWSPPGLAGQAMADAARGRLLAAAAEVALAAAFVALLLWWWSRSLERASTTAEATTAAAAAHRRRWPRRAAGDRLGGPLLPRLAPWLPANRAGAVAAKDLRYGGREPRRRVQVLMGVLVPLFALLPTLVRGGLEHPQIVLVSVFVAFMFAGTTSLNAIGIDGAPYWLNVAAGNDPRADLLGKNLATFTLGLPITAVAAVSLAAISGGWRFVPLAVALAVGVLGVGLGVGDVASVRAPQPQPESGNPWATTSGQGCANGVLAMLAFVAELVVLVPLAAVVMAGFRVWSPALVLAAPFAVAYGATVWWIGLRTASRWAWWRLPELLEAISPSRA